MSGQRGGDPPLGTQTGRRGARARLLPRGLGCRGWNTGHRGGRVIAPLWLRVTHGLAPWEASVGS